MRCAWVQERLPLYISKELEPRERARVTEHLAICETCVSLMIETEDNMAIVRNAVHATEMPAPSLDARILARIQAMPERRFPLLAFPHTRQWRSIAALACAVALLAAGYQWGKRQTAPRSHSAMLSTSRSLPVLDLATLSEAHNGDRGAPSIQGLDDKSIAANLARATGLPVSPVALNDSAIQLIGARIVHVDQTPIAVRRFRWNGAPVSLVQSDSVRLDLPFSLRDLRHHGHCYVVHQSEGHTFIFWCAGRVNSVLIADVPPSQLFNLACRICAKFRES